ncbi:hypothetical protein [Spongiimicrobium salis]|uniref:hypothetical protein n=1 Tax=Spongiimicrobium salis TaxID=1667022 RepID=UPI00374DDD64
MKKRYLLLVFYIFFIVSLNAQEYFEGELQYKITYESNNGNLPISVLEREFGKSFTAYVKEDRYAMIYHGEGQNGWMKTIVRLDQGYSYTEFEKLDTIVKTKFGSEKNNLMKFDRNANNKKEILEETCESVTLEYKPMDPNSFFSEMRGTYYFNPKYKLNAALYSEYTDGFWNLFVKESQSISIRNETEFYPLFKSIQEAISIEEKSMDDSIFEPNPNKVLKTN